MKILLLSNMYPSDRLPSLGIFVYNQAQALQKDASLSIAPVVAYEKTETWPGKIVKYLKLHLRAWFALFKRFDLVHLHYAASAHILAATPILFFSAKPIVATIHGSELRTLPKKGSRHFVVRSFLARAQAIICVSNDLKIMLNEKTGLPSSRIRVIDVGCDLSRFHPRTPPERERCKTKLGLPTDRFILLFVGRLIALKGLDVLLRALSLMEDSAGVQLLVIGAGPEREKLETKASKLGLEDRIRWLGEKPPEELPEWYAASDLFVLPSRGEGTPAVILEAMASGCPIVASRVGGIPEVIADGINGLLAEPGNQQQLLESINRLRRDPERRELLAKQAVIDAADHSLDRQAGRIAAVYRSVLEAKTKQA